MWSKCGGQNEKNYFYNHADYLSDEVSARAGLELSVSDSFKNDFNVVMNYYQVDREEAAFEKKRCLANLYDAMVCYSIIAAGVRAITKG